MQSYPAIGERWMDSQGRVREVTGILTNNRWGTTTVYWRRPGTRITNGMFLKGWEAWTRKATRVDRREAGEEKGDE